VKTEESPEETKELEEPQDQQEEVIAGIN
jgi:hypothetical protein